MAKLTRDGIERFFDNHVLIETRTIYLGDGSDGGIDSNVAEDFIKALHILNHTNTEPVNIILNSFGGCWYNGMAIYDAIKHSESHINCYVIGSAMSMGSIVLQAADMRYIYPSATIMIHDGYETIVNATPQTFVNWAESSSATRQAMYRIYAERTGKNVAFWKKRCANDFILSAKDALSLGLVDEIVGANHD